MSYPDRDYWGEKNPNWSNAAARTCIQCGGAYASYNKTRKYCSHACYSATRPKAPPRRQLVLQLRKPPPPPKAPKPPPIEKACLHCHTVFVVPPSLRHRLYCCYPCHVASGGAFRAGLASSKAVMRYGAKKDANHDLIFAALRDANVAVYDLSAHGCGVPDGVAWIKEQWCLFEVKNPKTSYGRKGLNPVQKKWLKQWQGGPVYMVYTVDEAKKFAEGDFDAVKCEQGAVTE